MTQTRTPDEIMADFTAAVNGQADIDPHEILGEILADVLDTVQMAAGRCGDITMAAAIVAEVTDYVVNHYGED